MSAEQRAMREEIDHWSLAVGYLLLENKLLACLAQVS